MLIELPIAVLKNSPNKDLANKFIQFVKIEQRAGGLRPVRVPARSTRRRSPRQFKQFPVRPGQFTINDKTIGGWRAADKKWFDPNKGLMVKIEQRGRRAHLWLASRKPRARARGRRNPQSRARGSERPSRSALSRPISGWSSRCRSRRSICVVDAARRSGFWDAVTNPEALAALEADPRGRRDRGADQRGRRDDHRLGARPRRLPRQVARERVIDLPFALPTIVAGLAAARALRAAARRSASTSPSRATAILFALLFVTLPFVVRTVQPVLLELDAEMEEAARSLGASELHRLPPDRPAEHPARDPLRA